MHRDAVPLIRTEGSGLGAPAGTLERGLAVLEVLATKGQASAAEVAAELEVSRSATYRLIGTLQERGYIEPAGAANQLRLGMRAAEIGMAAVAGIDGASIAPPYLARLVEQTAETAFVAVVDGHEVVYLHKEPGPHSVQMSAQLGSRRPLHSTGLGKAFLSALTEERCRALVAELDLRGFTPNTITDRDALLDELARTRMRGYAVDNVEGEDGVACAAAPVLDYRGLPVVVISIAGPADRVLPRMDVTGPLVAETAAMISRRLGDRGDGHAQGRVQA